MHIGFQCCPQQWIPPNSPLGLGGIQFNRRVQPSDQSGKRPREPPVVYGGQKTETRPALPWSGTAHGYDSLGRMTQAVNPESGTTCSTYDDNGNLSTRQQAGSSTYSPGNGVLTSYNYDYLNRLTSKVMPEGNVTY